MHLDGADDREEDGEEDGVLARVVAGRQEVPSAVGDRPVAVLAGAVHALEGLLVQEADEAVALRRLAQHLHDHHVVVDGEVQVLEHRRELELRRRDLVVARLRGDAELPEARLDLGHELEDARLDRAEVVVFELLVLRGRRAEHRAPRLEEVGPLHVEPAVDEKVLLLRAEGDLHMRLRLAELGHEALYRPGDGLYRPQEGRLHVERVARERAERRWDAQRRTVLVALDEGRRRRVPRRVAARLESGADATRREGRCVGLADDKVLAAELHDRLAVLELKERVVLLGGGAGHREEPVRVVRRTAIHRPVADAVRDFARDRRIKRFSFPNRRLELLRRVLAQIFVDRLFAEHVGSEVGCGLCLFRHLFVSLHFAECDHRIGRRDISTRRAKKTKCAKTKAREMFLVAKNAKVAKCATATTDKTCHA